VLPRCPLDPRAASDRYTSPSVLPCCWQASCRLTDCRMPRSASCHWCTDCEPAPRANDFFCWTPRAATVAPMSALLSATSRCASLTRCVLRLCSSISSSQVDRSPGRDLLSAAPRPGPSDSLLGPTFLRRRRPAITPGRLGVCKNVFCRFRFSWNWRPILRVSLAIFGYVVHLSDCHALLENLEGHSQNDQSKPRKTLHSGTLQFARPFLLHVAATCRRLINNARNALNTHIPTKLGQQHGIVSAPKPRSARHENRPMTAES
jgi:hypothetical protein